MAPLLVPIAPALQSGDDPAEGHEAMHGVVSLQGRIPGMPQLQKEGSPLVKRGMVSCTSRTCLCDVADWMDCCSALRGSCCSSCDGHSSSSSRAAAAHRRESDCGVYVSLSRMTWVPAGLPHWARARLLHRSGWSPGVGERSHCLGTGCRHVDS